MSSAERVAGHAHHGAGSCRSRPARPLEGIDHRTPSHAAADAHSPGDHVYIEIIEGRHAQDHRATEVSRGAVAAGLHRESRARVTGSAQKHPEIVDVRRLRHRGRSLLDGEIPRATRLVEGVVGREQERAGQCRAGRLERRGKGHDATVRCRTDIVDGVTPLGGSLSGETAQHVPERPPLTEVGGRVVGVGDCYGVACGDRDRQRSRH